MIKCTNRIGEKNINTKGHLMTIIAYRDANHIDIEFEDGTIVYNKKYEKFKDGLIKNPNLKNFKCSKRIGEQTLAINGMKMTIINYINYHNISVKFEDGTIVYNKQYSGFKKGTIKHPQINSIIDKQKNERLGKINKANNNQKMTIIEYRSSNNIDVQFEDGTIVNNKSYLSFLNGQIKNPNKKTTRKRETRLNETIIAKNGQKMTIIRYRNCKDLDVRFEDGIVVTNKSYKDFKNGSIKNPNVPVSHYLYKNVKEKWINDSKLNISNGLYMTIIDYISSNNITILFETGYKKIATVNTYRIGTIRHPFPYQMESIILEKPAYIHNNIGNFYCTCSKCGHKDIMTIEEMKNHICK